MQQIVLHTQENIQFTDHILSIKNLEIKHKVAKAKVKTF